MPDPSKDLIERAYKTLDRGVGSLPKDDVVRPAGTPAEEPLVRSASQGLKAAFHFARASRRDADRE
jgi:hypothetical protein